jgi:hypothetical protein
MKTSIFSFAAGIAFLAISAFSISMPGYQVGDMAKAFHWLPTKAPKATLSSLPVIPARSPRRMSSG